MKQEICCACKTEYSDVSFSCGECSSLKKNNKNKKNKNKNKEESFDLFLFDSK